MKKMVRALIVLLNLIVPVSAATMVNGTIDVNTVWDKAGSPYIVTNGNLLIDTLTTLTIRPGVIVQLDSARSILAKGSIIAEGTASDSIVITKYGTERWARLWLQGGTSTFKYCRIEYAFASAIYNVGADSLYVGFCTIANNQALARFGGSGGGIYFCAPARRGLIEKNLIFNNYAQEFDGNVGGMGGGIYAQGSYFPTTIIENTIFNNSAYYGGGICNDFYALIIKNTVTGNRAALGGGIYHHNEGTLTGNTIANNTATQYGGGIHSSNDDSVLISFNVLTNNSAPAGGSIFCESQEQSFIRWNTITDTTATALYFTRSSCNAIIRTNTIAAAGIAVYQKEFCDIDARYNYWSTTAEDTIKKKIHDYFDDFTKGIVAFRPFLKTPTSDTAAPGIPTGLKAIPVSDSLYVISWTNPFDQSGIAEYYYKLYSPPSSPFDTTGRLHTAPDTISSENGSLYVWLVDSSGNLDHRNYSTVSLRHAAIRPSLRNAATSQGVSMQVSPSVSGMTVRYFLPAKTNVQITVFNAAGHRIINECVGRKDRGFHTRLLQYSRLAPGTYLIRLTAKGFSPVTILTAAQ